MHETALRERLPKAHICMSGCGKCLVRFYKEIYNATVLAAGLPVEPAVGYDARVRVRGLPEEMARAWWKALAEAVRTTTRKSFKDEFTFRYIIMEIYYAPFWKYSAISLDEFFRGLDAGNMLAAMEAHSAALERQRTEITAYNHTERAKERRRLRVRELLKHRSDAKRMRDELRARMLMDLKSLTPLNRLVAVAHGSLALDAIPSSVVEISSAALPLLDANTKVLLLRRIGRRTGHWRRLAARLRAVSPA